MPNATFARIQKSSNAFDKFKKPLWRECRDSKVFNESLYTVRHIDNVAKSLVQAIIGSYHFAHAKPEAGPGVCDGGPLHVGHYIPYGCLERLCDIVGPTVQLPLQYASQ